MSDINDYLSKLLKKLEFESAEKIKIDKSIANLKKNIWGIFQNRLHDVAVFGSYDRETMIPPRLDDKADVDILVIFKKGEFQPKTYLDQIKAASEKVYNRSEVYSDNPTVVIELEHVKFEITPAIPDEDNWRDTALLIPGPPKEKYDWIETNPTKFKEKLIAKNNSEAKMMVPIIKLIKFWNIQNGKHFSPYWLEDFAISNGYSFCKDLKDHFFELISDLNNQSYHEDSAPLISTLYEHRRKLLALTDKNIPEYIEAELSSFLPMPTI